MKLFFRLFFRTIRLIVGPFLLAYEWLATRSSVDRSPEAQSTLDKLTSPMALYQFKTCPFCVKTRIAVNRLGLNIEMRDAQFDQEHRATLEEQGGKVQVPALRIQGEDGQVTWLYESDAIIQHLQALAAD